MSELIGFKQEEKTEFELSGLNADELGFMRADERRAVIEAAGLNPDEYDFWSDFIHCGGKSWYKNWWKGMAMIWYSGTGICPVQIKEAV